MRINVFPIRDRGGVADVGRSSVLTIMLVELIVVAAVATCQ